MADQINYERLGIDRYNGRFPCDEEPRPTRIFGSRELIIGGIAAFGGMFYASVILLGQKLDTYTPAMARVVGDVSIPEDGVDDLRVKMENGRYQVIDGVKKGRFSGRDNKAGIPWSARRIADPDYPDTDLVITREGRVEFPMTYDVNIDAYIPVEEDLNNLEIDK